MSNVSELLVSLVMVAIVGMLVTRPGVAQAFRLISQFVAQAIRATLGVV